MLLYILHTHRVKKKKSMKAYTNACCGYTLPAALHICARTSTARWVTRKEEENTVYHMDRGNSTGWNDAKEKKIHTVWTRDEEGAALNPREKAAEKQHFPGFTAGAASEGLHWQPVSPRNEFNTLLIIDAHQNTDVTHTWWECIHFLLDDSFCRREPSICW